MDELLIKEMDKTNCPSTNLIIIEDGKTTLTRSYGARNFEKNIPTTPDTLYCIGSVTKSIVCAAVLKLHEQGDLDVDNPIHQYLPIQLGYDDNPITMHHLMTHSSGIPNLADRMWARNEENKWNIDQEIPKYPFSSWRDAFRFIKQAQDFIAEPGTRFHYNNLGYGLLSKIISDVSGVPYKNFIKTQILDPLDMSRSGFYSQIRDDDNVAIAYRTMSQEEKRNFVPVSYDDIMLSTSLDEAAGGLFSSVNELSNFMKMLLNNGVYNGNMILSDTSISAMQDYQFREEFPNSAFAAMYGQSDSGYGYGFAIDGNFYGKKLVQHSGSFIGASAWFAFLPNYDRGVIMLSNHHPSPRIFTQAVLAESLGKDCTREWDFLKLRKFHDELTGRYETYKGLNKISIISESGQLFLQPEGSNQRTGLIPLGTNLYTLNYYLPTEIGGKLPAQFIRDGDNTWLHIEREKWKKIR